MSKVLSFEDGNAAVISSLDREDIPENGSLLFINVKSACNITSHDVATMKTPHTRYRVLHIEEEAQSSLFKAKTPIYTSDYVDGTDPTWDDQPFRFEMLYPEGMREIRGEIAISLYSSDIQTTEKGTSTGTSAVFFGQVSFSIASIIKSGNLETVKHIEGLNGRSIEGNFRLLSQSGKALDSDASINVHLHLFWWDMGDAEEQDNSALEHQDTSLRSRFKDVAASTKSGRPKSVNTRLNGSKAGTGTATGTATRQSNIVSGNQKKKMTVNFQIEKENLKLLKKLEKLSGKKSEAYIDATKSTRSEFTEDDYIEVITKSGKPAKRLISSLSDAEALEFLGRLKPEVASLKNENDNLRGLINQQKSLLRKYDATLSKSADFNTESASQQLQMPKGLENSDSSQSNIFKRLGLVESKICDKEILDLAQEHEILQSMRRALVDNIKKAKSKELESKIASNAAQEKVKSFLRRLNLLYPQQNFVGDLLNGDVKISNSSEINLVENINNLRADMETMELFEKEELYCSELLNSISELRSIITYLEKTRDGVKRELQNQQFERDAAEERFSRVADNNYIGQMREMLSNIRAIRSEYRKRKELFDVKTSIDNAELKLVQLNLSKQERKFKLQESIYDKS